VRNIKETVRDDSKRKHLQRAIGYILFCAKCQVENAPLPHFGCNASRCTGGCDLARASAQAGK
ncbi:MAG: hypothetical protein ACPHO7_02395, partial [Candidatus Puniceispirillaceae bacterium]